MITEILLAYLKAFAVGGTICAIAQLLINYTKITSGKILVYFMLSGLLLQSVGLYQYLVDFGGAGATVPISGFGYLLANGAIKGQKQSFRRVYRRTRRGFGRRYGSDFIRIFHRAYIQGEIKEKLNIYCDARFNNAAVFSYNNV